jgi:hypothetical protein
LSRFIESSGIQLKSFENQLQSVITMSIHRGLIILGVVLLCAVPTSALAATIVVTNTADSGSGTLRSAPASATNGDTIDATGASGTILLGNAELVVSNSVTVGATVTQTNSLNQVTISLPISIQFYRLFLP